METELKKNNFLYRHFHVAGTELGKKFKTCST